MNNFNFFKKHIPLLVIVFTFAFYPAQMNVLATEIDSYVYIQPDYELFLDKDYLYIDLILESEEKQINATKISLNFEANKLRLEEINYENSFCNIFIKEEIDNIKGNYQITCGSTNISATKNNVTRLKFNKIKSGWTKMNIGDSNILESNGLGTSLSTDNEIHRIYIVK